jgi:hypothetical protein
MPRDFAAKLEFGQLAESDIGRWTMARGSCVLPVYEIEIPHGKGPRFWTPRGTYVAPDMFVMPSMIWIEAKHKSVFSWHRITRRWVTGIDLHHYQDYLRTQEESGRPVWLLFLHGSPHPHSRDIGAGCPPECPTGLFGASLKMLAANENHRHENWGRHGMVYWAVPPLKKLAEFDEVRKSTPRGLDPAA